MNMCRLICNSIDEAVSQANALADKWDNVNIVDYERADGTWTKAVELSNN